VRLSCFRAYSDSEAHPEKKSSHVPPSPEKARLSASSDPVGGPLGDELVSALHKEAERLRHALVEQESLTKGPWFAQKWLGIDKNAWMRSLGYQASLATA
jgi:hypothetical protein